MKCEKCLKNYSLQEYPLIITAVGTSYRARFCRLCRLKESGRDETLEEGKRRLALRLKEIRNITLDKI